MSNGNWYWTSWGIKGVEDLGGGNAAIFTLQQAFKLNNGEGVASSHGTTSSGGFNNQAFLGLQGPWGRLTFGHQAGLSSGDGDYSMLGGSAIGTGFDMIGDVSGRLPHNQLAGQFHCIPHPRMERLAVYGHVFKRYGRR